MGVDLEGNEGTRTMGNHVAVPGGRGPVGNGAGARLPEYKVTGPHRIGLGDQVWACSYCGQERAWGQMWCGDKDYRALLNCDGVECQAAGRKVTRHVFLRINQEL
jgi:hypothetical protein